jgi:hypothetical protein
VVKKAKNVARLNINEKKKRINCNCGLFKFGSWVRRMVITVNMKPEIKSSPPPRFDRCLI